MHTRLDSSRCRTLLRIMNFLLLSSLLLLNFGDGYKVNDESWLPSMEQVLYFILGTSDRLMNTFTRDVNTTDILIRQAGFEPEVHSIITADGYILRLTRLKTSQQGPPVLLVHGLTEASESWIKRGRKEDLAFILAERGFDVWLADLRGNVYSRKHRYLKEYSAKFWNFSFHEIAVYDLPACINTVLAHSSYPKLFYIGHSMGTTVFFILASTRPEYNKLIQTAIMLSPVVFFIKKQKSILISEAVKHFDSIKNTLTKARIYKLFDRNLLTEKFVKLSCSPFIQLFGCLQVLEDMYGENRDNINKEKIADYLKAEATGASVKSVAHFIQIIKTGEFSKFDYGREKNLEIYKTFNPPKYSMNRVTAPVVLFYSRNDPMSDDLGVEKLARRVPNVIYKEVLPKYSHLDYVFGEDAPNILFSKIVTMLIQNK